MTRDDESAWVRDQIAGLDDDLLQVVSLRMEGLTFKEIGEHCDLSEGVTRRRFIQAA
ncbi:MAG: DNA-directed RNA polymerase specialized sigma24 family protein [Planctomycetota bacterium]